MLGSYERNAIFNDCYRNLKGRLENLLITPGGSIINIRSQLNLLLQEFNALWAKQSAHEQKQILEQDTQEMTEMSHLTVLILKRLELEERKALVSHLSPAMQEMISKLGTFKV